MKLLDAFRARLSLLLRSRADSRMDDEFRFHLEMETEANLRKGFTPAEARRRALVAFGGVERHRERMREQRGAAFFDRTARELRQALRALRRAPAFSVTATLTLALGIGSVTTIFSLVDRILIRRSPTPSPTGSSRSSTLPSGWGSSTPACRAARTSTTRSTPLRSSASRSTRRLW